MSKEWDLPDPVSLVASSLCIPAELQSKSGSQGSLLVKQLHFELQHITPSLVPSPPTHKLYATQLRYMLYATKSWYCCK